MAAKTNTCRGSYSPFGTFLASQATAKNKLTNRWPQMYSILLVDDDPNSRPWSLILADEGYRVTCASNGIEALECLKHHVPNLIVTDWIMPLMDGLCSVSRDSSST